MTVSLESRLQRLVTEPTLDDLWHLHPHLLAYASPEAEEALDLAQMFYCYLSCVQSKLTAKQYSTVAAMLAAGSVGLISLQDIVQAAASDREQAARHLLVGGLAEALEVLSTVQHVKAWETEFASVQEEAVWHLYGALWKLSVETQPDLSTERRSSLIDGLLSVVRDTQVSSSIRAAMIIRLFQILLAIRLAPLIAASAPGGSE